MRGLTDNDGIARFIYPLTFTAITAVSAIHIGGDPVSMVALAAYWTNSNIPILVRDELTGTSQGGWGLTVICLGII